jgi:redox-sensitive bicupin YhaK (pirin superfamily)
VIVYPPRVVPLGGVRAMNVRRTIPRIGRTTIGAWCFLDHYGPNDVQQGDEGMAVPPHPHTGLQTVSWLFEGEIEHTDSVGSHQLINPGAVNLMTAGRGIQHVEVSTPATKRLHGVQLWIALPETARHNLPFFEHHIAPRASIGRASVTVFVGEMLGVSAPTTVFSPLVGAEILIPAGERVEIPTNPEFEYGVLVDAGDVSVNDEVVEVSHLAYEPVGADRIVIEAGERGARVIFIGGVPFGEKLVMWWNFVGRDHDEIEAFRAKWQNEVVSGVNHEGHFGFVAYPSGPLPAPEMPTVRLRPRG